MYAELRVGMTDGNDLIFTAPDSKEEGPDFLVVSSTNGDERHHLNCDQLRSLASFLADLVVGGE